MKSLLFWSLFFVSGIFVNAQDNPFAIQCIEPALENATDTSLLAYCGNTSPYYSSTNLYLPQSNDEIIYIKVNFIFLTKPDGTGNFQQNNTEHVQVIDDLIEAFNYRLGNLGVPVQGCTGYGQNNLTDTKIRVIVNKIWKVDPAWDFLYTGYEPSQGPLGGTMLLYPPSSNYYYTYLDNDPSIPKGINIVFANDGNVYNDFINENYQNYPNGNFEQWAASEFPYYTPLDRKLRQFFPNIFNKYIYMRDFVVGNPTWGSQPWSVVRGWFLGLGYASLPHELGHNFTLSHQDCGSNIMSYEAGNHDYFNSEDISKMYKSAFITSVRQYFTDNSFKNTSIPSNTNQLWDLNFRLYSNVKIDDNSSLKATCKIIMAPESRIIVKNGSNFIIEGADISSANNSSWNGIKVEGNGYALILPDTQIDNGYFYAYTDNTFLPNGKSSNEYINNINDKNTILQEEDLALKIFPNPTGDFINIQTKEKIERIEVLDMRGNSKKIKNNEKNKINVSNLSSGYYILKINFHNKVITKKFIKK